MTIAPDRKALQLRSLVKENGELELSLVRVDVPRPADGEVLVRVDAAPIHPSDQILLLALADPSTAKLTKTADGPVVTARIPEKMLKTLSARVGKSMTVGNEGAGVVVEAGSSPAAQALVGKTVALLGGAMYSQYRCIGADQCLPLAEGTTAVEGAAAFVNPLTALGFVETMRREGHTALVHTAAASTLGQMLQRLCTKDGIGLVNIVRKDEQAALLKEIGAKYVVNSSAPTFLSDLTDALAATGATLGFDAIGGGKLAGQILGCMEAAINRKATEYSRYGSSTHKQVYIYGALDNAPTELSRNYGLAWGLGGWLVMPFLAKVGPIGTERLRRRVVSDLKTTFATTYAKEVSLSELLEPAEIAAYAQRSTGGKYLVTPNKTPAS